MEFVYGEEENNTKEVSREVSRGCKRRGVGDEGRSQHLSRLAEVRGANLEDSNPKDHQDINKIISVLRKSAVASHLMIIIVQAVILHTVMVPITSPRIVTVKEFNKQCNELGEGLSK